MVEEARLEKQDVGPVPVTDGWFVVKHSGCGLGDEPNPRRRCIFERDAAPFPDVGFTLAVLQPGQSGGRVCPGPDYATRGDTRSLP